MPDLNQSNFVSALAAGTDQPRTAFAALCEYSRAEIGHKLFTLMVFDEATFEACRIYSNMPDAYPVSGKKPGRDDIWAQKVIKGRETFVANSIEDIAEVFPDFELIQSLGCESVINVPIFVGDRFLGSINCLHEAGFYTQKRVQDSELLKLPGAACFLMNTAFFETGGQ
ncbi:MAG: GAF domain-containing protein [Pseudomonadota bacterium]